jgi:hypothetical protein
MIGEKSVRWLYSGVKERAVRNRGLLVSVVIGAVAGMVASIVVVSVAYMLGQEGAQAVPSGEDDALKD